MKAKNIESFTVIGIKIRTTNQNMQASKDIPAVWQRFVSEEIAKKIPNKIDDAIYAIYTNYESDYQGAYDMILGCKVSTKVNIPEGMIAQEFKRDKYIQFISKGRMKDNSVYKTWTKIWATDLDRSYNADFEIYSKKSRNPEDMEVDIFISVK